MRMRALLRCNVALVLVMAMPAASIAPAWGASAPVTYSAVTDDGTGQAAPSPAAANANVYACAPNGPIRCGAFAMLPPAATADHLRVVLLQATRHRSLQRERGELGRAAETNERLAMIGKLSEPDYFPDKGANATTKSQQRSSGQKSGQLK